MESSRKPSGSLGNRQQHDKAALARSPARSRVSGADGGRDGAGSGAPPSNTAPDTCNGSFKALRWGVDSLYLSYPGELGTEVLIRLKALKEMAQAQDPHQKSLAQYPLGGHVFEVKDKGAQLFPYILEDGSFRVQLSQGGKVPMAYCKISSAFLAHVGPAQAERELRALLEHLGVVAGPAQVSRIDLFADFVWTASLEWDREAWITRAISIDSYSEHGTFTGWVVGKGGVMMARLYNKSFQAAKLGIDYLAALWRQAGRKDDETVWRLEFQIKREVLAQMQIAQFSDTLAHLNGLWCYASTEWLRLAIPSTEDQTRSRWPIHPLWGYLSSIDWETSGGPLLRAYTPARVPSDGKLFSLYLSALVAFMAKRGIRDLYRGQEELVAAVVQFYTDQVFYREGLSFDDYFAERVALKAREFNTMANDPELLAKIEEDEQMRRARAYRRASKGG